MSGAGASGPTERAGVHSRTGAPATAPAAPSRGGEAETPLQIPSRGWKDIVARTWREVRRDNVPIVAAGLAYYALLALFPALILLVSVYGLAFDKTAVAGQFRSLASGLPGGVQHVVQDELDHIARSPKGILGFGALGGLLFALYSITCGAAALIAALNIAYEVDEKRGFLHRTLLTLGLALLLLLVGLLSIALLAGLPVVIDGMRLPVDTRWALMIVKWPLLAAMLMGVLAVLYRYAPHRPTPKWRWITPGALVATALWLLGSVAFTVYATNFGNFNATYGSLGALIVLLTWMYLSGYVVLLGAELNSEAERQTSRRTAQ